MAACGGSVWSQGEMKIIDQILNRPAEAGLPNTFGNITSLSSFRREFISLLDVE